MVDNKRQSNPFYHYILGEQAYDDEQYEAAISHYQKGLKLDNTRHEILFGLAKTYYESGDITNAEQYLARAMKHADNRQDKSRYQSKLSALANN